MTETTSTDPIDHGPADEATTATAGTGSRRRRNLLIGLLVLVVVVAAAVVAWLVTRSDDTTPDAATAHPSESAFCGSFTRIGKDLGALGPKATDAERVRAFKEAGRRIEQTGTPSSISDQARSGFETTVRLIAGLPDDASMQDLAGLDSGLDATEKKQVQAFDAYVTDKCQA